MMEQNVLDLINELFAVIKGLIRTTNRLVDRVEQLERDISQLRSKG